MSKYSELLKSYVGKKGSVQHGNALVEFLQLHLDFLIWTNW